LSVFLHGSFEDVSSTYSDDDLGVEEIEDGDKGAEGDKGQEVFEDTGEGEVGASLVEMRRPNPPTNWERIEEGGSALDSQSLDAFFVDDVDKREEDDEEVEEGEEFEEEAGGGGVPCTFRQCT
jgi:hypothetical protein